MPGGGKKKREDQIDRVVSKADIARTSGKYDEAVKLFERARSTNPMARNQVRAELAQSCLGLAEQRAGRGDCEGALATLRSGYDPQLPERLKDRLAQAYVEYYTRAVARSIAERAPSARWRRVGVVPFVELGEGELDGEAVAGRICRAIADTRGLSVSVRTLSAKGAGMLMSGAFDDLPAEDRDRLRQWGDDALVLGRVGRELSTFVGDVRRATTDVVQVAENLASATLAPAASWDEPLAEESAKRGFQVRAWVGEQSFRAGALLRFSVRSNRDCFLTVILLQSDRTAYSFLPILEQRRNYAAAGVTYAIPDPNGTPFDLPISGPPGTQRITVVATRKPLDLGVVGSILSENDLSDMVAAQLGKLLPDDWAVAACSFQVVD